MKNFGTMSRASLMFVMRLTTITLFSTVVTSQPPTKPNLQYILCNWDMGSYSDDSPYETNLRTVLFTLQQQASDTATSAKFYNTSSGTDPDTVYGQYYCRGDIGTQLCGDCVKEAAQKAFNTCSQQNTKGGIVWYQECTLRYSDQSMYGVPDDLAAPQHPYSIAYSGANVPSDPRKFSVALNDTLSHLIDEAVSTNTKNLFSTGESREGDLTVYCLVQCSPDLNEAQCNTCLQSIYGHIWTCCGQWPAFLYALYPSCHIMYNTGRVFYYNINSTPSAPPPSISPGTPPSISPPPVSPGSPPSISPPPISPGSQPSIPPPSPLSPDAHPPPPSTNLQPEPSPSTGSQQPPPPPPSGSATLLTVRTDGFKLWIPTISLVFIMLLLCA